MLYRYFHVDSLTVTIAFHSCWSLFSTMGYHATEASNLSVEVCVEVMIGTINQIASVDVQTVSQSATDL